jgi:hypothetical protein
VLVNSSKSQLQASIAETERQNEKLVNIAGQALPSGYSFRISPHPPRQFG